MTPTEQGECSKQKILIVVNSLQIGGPQKSLIGILQRVDQTQYEVTLLVLQGKRPGDLSEFIPDGIVLMESPSVYRAATLPRGEMFLSIRSLLDGLSLYDAFRLATSLGVAGLTERTGSRIRQRFWSLVAKNLPRIPGRFDAAIGILGQSTYAIVDLACSEHKYHWVRSDTRVLRRNEEIEARYFRKLSGALAVSEECRNIYVDVYPFMVGRVRVYKNDIPDLVGKSAMPNSVVIPQSEAGVERCTTRLLTIARLDPLKGLDLAIEACALLMSSGFKVDWVVLGEGPERATLEQLIKQRGVANEFKLLGSVLDTRSWLEWSDIYVHPSRAEGRSNAVEEARRLAVPIVAANYPTVTDQVRDGVNGLVVDTSAAALVSGIVKLSSDPSLANRLGACAQSEYLSERDDPNDLFSQLVLGTAIGLA
ncbi:glycosyltransferase [Dietzia maris]